MFNDRYGLTQAVLDGRKTMTRRIIPNEFFSLTWDVRGNTLVYENADGDFIDIRNCKYCLYKLGEVVAVAQDYSHCGGIMSNGVPRWEYISKVVGRSSGGWRNKMFVRADFMPHQIRITSIRIERLQEISDEDCLREGIRYITDINKYYFERTDRQEGFYFDTASEAFASLIDKVSGRGTWESNPYVVVYSFELVK